MVRAFISIVVLGLSNLAAAQTSTSDVERLQLDATHGIAPQPPRVADLYRRARPLTEPTFTGMWLCEVTVTGDSWDGADPSGPVRRYMGRVELDAEIALPRRHDVVRVRGPDDTNRVAFAVAGVTVATGETLSIDLSDRDVLTNDAIGHVDLAYTGSLPIRAQLPRASIECRGMTAEALASKIDEALAGADAAIQAIESVSRPNRALVGFRDPNADPDAATLAVYDVARYAGLADPRFLERRDALRSREAAFLAAVAELVRDLGRDAKPLGTPTALPGSRLELVVDQLDCAVEEVIELHAELGLDAPMDCAMRITIRNTGTSTATFGWTFHLVDDLGETTPITRFGTVDADGIHRTRTLRVPRGETRVVLACPTRRSVLLRTSQRRAVVWSRTTAEPRRGPGSEGPEPRGRGRDRANPNDPIDGM